MKKILFLLFSIFCFCMLLCSGQVENEMLDLDIKALMSVNVTKKSLPIEVDTQIIKAGNTVNIGFLLPLSKYADYANEMYNAASMAVDEINACTQINQKKLYLIKADDAGDKEVAAEKSIILSDKYKVAALLGPTSSNRVMYVAKNVSIAKNIPLMAVDATADAISDLDDKNLVWRLSLRDGLFNKTIADYLINKCNKKNVAIIYVNSQYGRGIYNQFANLFKQYGGNITYATSYSELVDIAAYNMQLQLDSLFATNPEVVYLITNAYEGAMITQKIKDGNYVKDKKIIFASSGANKGNDFLKLGAPEITENMIGVGSYNTQNDVFNKKYSQKFGVSPQYPEIVKAYDAVYLLAYSMVYAGSCEPLKFNDAIQKITNKGKKISDCVSAIKLLQNKAQVDFDGLSGNISFNEKGDIISGKCEIWQIQGQQFVTLSIVDVK